MRRAAPALLAVALLTLAGHGLLLRPLLDPGGLAARCDWAVRLADGREAGELLRLRHALGGYSTRFGAGRLAGLGAVPANRLTSLVLGLAGDADPAAVMAAFLAGALWCLPVLLALGARLRGAVAGGCVAALLAGVALVHLDRLLLTLLEHARLALVLAALLAVLAVAGYERCLVSPRLPAALGSGLLAGTALFLHGAMWWLLLPALVAAHLARGRARGAMPAAAAVAGLAVLGAVAGLHPQVASLGGLDGTGALPDLGSGAAAGAAAPVLRLLDPGQAPGRLLLIAVAASVALGDRIAPAMPVGALGCLLAAWTGGARLWRERAEPGELLWAAGLFACLPAVEALPRLWRRRPVRAALLAVAAVLLAASAWVPRELRPGLNLRDWRRGGNPFPAFAGLRHAVEAGTDRSARLLVERRDPAALPGGSSQDRESPRAAEAFAGAGACLGARLGLRLDREQASDLAARGERAGGLDLVEGRLGGRPLAAWLEEDLGEVLWLYNVGWVVALSPAARDALDGVSRHTLFVVERDPSFVLYRVSDPGGPVLIGSAEVSTGPGFIDVQGASSGGIVLKYHFHPALRSEPPLALTRFVVARDAAGFIQVDNGDTGEFRIRAP